LSAIIVEQHALKVLAMTDQAVILERGRIVYRARSDALRSDTAALESFLGAGGGTRPNVMHSELNSSV
jgi:branched-chain amino acid transport system ATP-binding protein